MTRTTLIVLASLGFVIGCQDEAPPAPATTAAPEPPADSRPRLAKIRPHAARAFAPGMRQNIADSLGDGGAEADASVADAAAPAVARVWSFDKDKADEAPPGFDLASSAGKPGKWRVMVDPGAPTAPHVLAQLDPDKTDGRFLTAVAAEPSLRDVRVSARCRAVSGKVDQSCGLVARFQDAKNYYVARANALEKDVSLYVVKDGKRTLLGGAKATIGATWHEIRLDVKGDHLEVYWDGASVYAVDDKSFPAAGRVGLWTKADSVTYFDELSAAAL